MISKKDLLLKMNISYGQLYRWKREGLIPDEWFIKQSVSSGQETYFDEKLIIPRIEKILDLKDKYQLDQLHDFFSPDISKRTFSVRELLVIEEIDPLIVRLFTKDERSISIYEASIIYILSLYKDELAYDDYIDYDYKDINSMNTIFYILDINGFYMLICDDNMIIDKKIKVYAKIKLEDIAKKIADKLH